MDDTRIRYTHPELDGAEILVRPGKQEANRRAAGWVPADGTAADAAAADPAAVDVAAAPSPTPRAGRAGAPVTTEKES